MADCYTSYERSLFPLMFGDYLNDYKIQDAAYSDDQ